MSRAGQGAGVPKSPEHKAAIGAALLARGVGASKAPKVCTECKERKPRSEFGLRTKNGYTYSRSKCKGCESAKQRRWAAANPDKQRALNVRMSLKRWFGLTLDQYNELAERQGGKCAICKVDAAAAPKGKLFVDHCAETNQIRGLLCGHCNTGIGMLRHSLEVLDSAARYLREPPITGLAVKPGMPCGVVRSKVST